MKLSQIERVEICIAATVVVLVIFIIRLADYVLQWARAIW